MSETTRNEHQRSRTPSNLRKKKEKHFKIEHGTPIKIEANGSSWQRRHFDSIFFSFFFYSTATDAEPEKASVFFNWILIKKNESSRLESQTTVFFWGGGMNEAIDWIRATSIHHPSWKSISHFLNLFFFKWWSLFVCLFFYNVIP